MDLRNNPSSPKIEMSDRPKEFALHALAAIEIHDQASQRGEKLTFPEIVKGDKVLGNPRDILPTYLLVSFGRNTIPVFRRFLTKSYGMTDAEIDSAILENITQVNK